MSSQYYLVREEDLPEVFLRILAVRKRLQKEPGLSVSRACAACNLSRSAFYKYRDSILPVSSKSEQELQVRCVFSGEVPVAERLSSYLGAKGVELIFWNRLPAEYPLQQLQIRLRVDQKQAERMAEAFRKELQGLAGIREWSVFLRLDPGEV